MGIADFQRGAYKIEHFPPLRGHERCLIQGKISVEILRSPETKISPSLLAPFFFSSFNHLVAMLCSYQLGKYGNTQG